MHSVHKKRDVRFEPAHSSYALAAHALMSSVPSATGLGLAPIAPATHAAATSATD